MKKCPKCPHQNPNAAKFCSECGANLSAICPKCGTENPSAAKFCIECGLNLAQGVEQKSDVPSGNYLSENPQRFKREAERRQLTLLFCDVVGSTPLSERLDPEEFRRVIIDYQDVAEKVIKRYGGHVGNYLGDGLLVYFGYPEGLENAPKAGVQAGLGIIEAVAHANQHWEKAGKTTIDIRIGIHTGEVVVDDHLALGAAANIAARLEGIAPSNGLVISNYTMNLVQGWFEAKSLGVQLLKGVSKPMEVFQVLRETGAKSRLEVSKVKGLSPLVGRKDEMALLESKWQQATEGNGNMVLLIGEAGIGKSRLADTLKEQVAAQAGAWLTEIRCLDYHQLSSFHPVIEFLETVVLQFDAVDTTEIRLNKLVAFLLQSGLDLSNYLGLFAEFLDLHSDRLQALDASPGMKKQRFMEGLTQALLNRAARQPVLFVVEDLHWADASTLEWLDMLNPLFPTSAILAIGTTRPGFRADWMSRSHVTQMSLNRLSEEKITAICQFHAKGKALPEDILAQVHSKTEGVPLFIEELTKTILESNLLVEYDDHYELQGPLPTLSIPSTLKDSFVARLDRLSSVNEVIRVGAVLGREFSLDMIKAVIDMPEEEINKAFSQLLDAELLFQVGVGNKVKYQFKHALIQNASYDTMLVSKRVALHQKVAEAIERTSPEILKTQPEIVAQHYTEAGLPIKAIPLWLNAGRLASQKHANAEAIAHLEKGRKLLDHIKSTRERDDLELDFALTQGGASIVLYGYTHPQVGSIFNLAREIAQKVAISPKLAFILYNLQTYYLLSEQHLVSQSLIEYILDIGKDPESGYLFLLFGSHIYGVSQVIKGNFSEGNRMLEKTAQLYDPQIVIPHELTPGGDVRINASSWWSVGLQIAGYAEHARRISEMHIRQVEAFKDSRTLYHIYVWIAWRCVEAKDFEGAIKIMETYIPIAEKFGDPFFILVSKSYYFAAKAYLGDADAVEMVENLVLAAVQAGATFALSINGFHIAELHYQFSRHQTALEWVEKTIQHNNDVGTKLHLAELYRIKGNILNRLGESEGLVEKTLQLALETARAQSAKTFELRAACDLARLWQKQNKKEDGRELVQGVYDWFTEGFDTVDLQEARALLAALA